MTVRHPFFLTSLQQEVGPGFLGRCGCFQRWRSPQQWWRLWLEQFLCTSGSQPRLRRQDGTWPDSQAHLESNERSSTREKRFVSPSGNYWKTTSKRLPAFARKISARLRLIQARVCVS